VTPVNWQLQEAKNRFSEVVNQACTKGPQVITRHGAEVAVIVSYADWLKLSKQQGKLSEFFQSSPLAPLAFDRDKSQLRNIDEFSA
jgi:antitoxin Phd